MKAAMDDVEVVDTFKLAFEEEDIGRFIWIVFKGTRFTQRTLRVAAVECALE